MQVYCEGCGQDCSQFYGTYKGYPYHIGCIPVRRKPKNGEQKETRVARAALTQEPPT